MTGAARNAILIRGFVDVAVAAQREQTQAGILKVAGAELRKLGLSVTLCELGDGCYRILEAGTGNPVLASSPGGDRGTRSSPPSGSVGRIGSPTRHSRCLEDPRPKER